MGLSPTALWKSPLVVGWGKKEFVFLFSTGQSVSLFSDRTSAADVKKRLGRCEALSACSLHLRNGLSQPSHIFFGIERVFREDFKPLRRI